MSLVLGAGVSPAPTRSCDMQVRRSGPQPTWDEYRSCRRSGRYLHTDRFGERWLFCKQHFLAVVAEGM